MALDPRTAPPRELVHAYTMTFGNETGRMVLADLTLFVKANMASTKDTLGRIDTASCVAQIAAERVLERIQSLAGMGKNAEWLAIERNRQMAEAEQKERQNG